MCSRQSETNTSQWMLVNRFIHCKTHQDYPPVYCIPFLIGELINLKNVLRKFADQ